MPNAMRALVGQTRRPDRPSAGERLKVANPDLRRRQRASHGPGRVTLLLTNDGPWPYAKAAIRRLEMRFSCPSKPLLSASPRKRARLRLRPHPDVAPNDRELSPIRKRLRIADSSGRCLSLSGQGELSGCQS